MRLTTEKELIKELFGISTKIVVLAEQNIKEKKINVFKKVSPALGHVLQAMKALRGDYIKHPFMDLISMPIDYLIELRDNEERKKSRCFIEYVYDIDVGEDNNCSFYANSWELSIETAEEWKKEFDEEIVKFDTITKA